MVSPSSLFGLRSLFPSHKTTAVAALWLFLGLLLTVGFHFCFTCQRGVCARKQRLPVSEVVPIKENMPSFFSKLADGVQMPAFVTERAQGAHDKNGTTFVVEASSSELGVKPRN